MIWPNAKSRKKRHPYRFKKSKVKFMNTQSNHTISLLFSLVRPRRLELPWVAPLPPQAGVNSYKSTPLSTFRAFFRHQKLRVSGVKAKEIYTPNPIFGRANYDRCNKRSILHMRCLGLWVGYAGRQGTRSGIRKTPGI